MAVQISLLVEVEVLQMHALAQELMYFVSFKMGEGPKRRPPADGEISPEIVENVCKILWVERYVFLADVSKFLMKHKHRMNSRIDLYILYNIYLCNQAKECFTYGYEVLIRTMTILFTMSTCSSGGRYLASAALSATILTFYYEKEIRADFNKQGGFEKFNRYLLQRDTLRLYSRLEVLEESGETRSNIMKMLKLQTSRLKDYLSKDWKNVDIESHEPSRDLQKEIVESGTGIIKHMVDSDWKCNFFEPDVNQGRTCNFFEADVNNRGKKLQAVSDYENPSKPEMSGNNYTQTQMEQNIPETSRIAYLNAKKQVKEFHEKCQKLEQLLDFIFEETS